MARRIHLTILPAIVSRCSSKMLQVTFIFSMTLNKGVGHRCNSLSFGSIYLFAKYVLSSITNFGLSKVTKKSVTSVIGEQAPVESLCKKAPNWVVLRYSFCCPNQQGGAQWDLKFYWKVQAHDAFPAPHVVNKYIGLDESDLAFNNQEFRRAKE